MIVSPQPDNSFDKYDEPRLHMEQLMKARLIEFDLSMRILCPLEKAGIRTLGDLVSRTRKDLRRISQLGRLSVDTIERFLADNGLALAQ
ncbi:MAG: DNA-directed RNA polymerase subunit alpha C-terminal domain-containing protein [Muribaculaceae bacterium]